MKIPFVSDFIDNIKYNYELKNIGKNVVSGGMTFMDLLNHSCGYGGEKYASGFGITHDYQILNLKLLQFRSIQLITNNDYANALFKRLETKVINKGLRLNSNPVLEILAEKHKLKDEYLRKWSRKIEARFMVWGNDRELVSWDKNHSWFEIQRMAYWTMLLSGDVLVILTINKQGLPIVKLIDGFYVSSPLAPGDRLKRGNVIKHGIEINTNSVHVAAWVESEDGNHVRIPFYSSIGRKRAFMVYATKRRLSDVRGLPALAVCMQNINEISKYRDSEQRAALVNSYIAGSRTRAEGQSPIGGGHRGRSPLSVKTLQTNNGDNVKFEESQPGLFMANLAPGETYQSYDTKRPNVNFGVFVDQVLKPIAYSQEIPPEIFFLEFSGSFSASRQAANELFNFLAKAIKSFSTQMCDRIYIEWLTGQVLNGDIEAPGYVASLNDTSKWDVKNSWQNATWKGLPNISVDFKKQIAGLKEAVDAGWITAEEVSETYFNSDYFDNMRRRSIEIDVKRSSEGVEIINPNHRIDSENNLNGKIDSVDNKIDSLLDLFSDIENTLDGLQEKEGK